MRGGRVLWLLNGVQFSTDVLTSEGYTPAIALDLRLSDMLFRYGVRVNPALVQDQQCLPVPVNVSSDPTTPNYQPLPWYYAPLLLTSYGSPITRNCMQVSATFASPVEAVGGRHTEEYPARDLDRITPYRRSGTSGFIGHQPRPDDLQV